MQIAPNIPRDFDELVKSYQEKNKVNINKIVENILPAELLSSKPRNETSTLILESILALSIKLYENLRKLEYVNEDILYFFKVLIYDYYDFYQSYSSFCGVQIFSVMRSLCDHSRMFILCLCDNEFMEFYFSGYENDEEKKDRYYKKRETKVSEKLKEIAKKAKEMNEGQNFYVESSVYNLTTELYSELTDKLGEVSHMSEITFTKELIPVDKELSFIMPKEWKILKFKEKMIEYLITTSLVTEVLFFTEDINLSNEEICIYNFLNWMSEEMYKFRNVDKLLLGLKEKVLDILTTDEENIE